MFLLSVVVVGLLAFFYAAFSILKDLPSPSKLDSPDSFAVSTQIFDRNGILLYEIYADENRTPIKLSD